MWDLGAWGKAGENQCVVNFLVWLIALWVFGALALESGGDERYGGTLYLQYDFILSYEKLKHQWGIKTKQKNPQNTKRYRTP